MSEVVEKSNAAPVCVYIAARGHSGSTMFELLLNRYPKIAAVGEVDQLPLQLVRDGIHTKWVGQCSCGALPADCEVWGAVYDQVSTNLGFDWSDNPFAFPVSDVGLAQEFGRSRPLAYLKLHWHRTVRASAHRLGIRLPGLFPYQTWVKNRELVYRVIAERRGVAAIVDASKDAMQMSDLVNYSELPVKVLFLTRDVRGNVWSAIRRNGASAAEEAKSWAAVNGQIYSRLKALPESSWMHVKYEDLCADTNAILDRIMSFLGMECEPIPPEEEHARRHTIAGNQVRFAALESIRHDVAWKDKLSAAQIDEIRRVAGPIAATLNYEI